MTGFRGQKFDFTGEDGAWYSVVDDGPVLQINMRGKLERSFRLNFLRSRVGAYI